jgi:hypothetical protein
MYRRCFSPIAVAIAFLLLAVGAPIAWTYTQSGVGLGFANVIPMGHEWVTRMAAIELIGYAPPTVPDIPDPNDPRKVWTQGLAKNLDLSSPGAQAEVARIKAQPYNDQRYASRYKPVYDAIVGERWVDIAGYNVLGGKVPGWVDCWDAVAQEPVEVQYDHFMRRYDEVGGAGGVSAASNSRQRFINYFVAAAIAPTTIMQVYDGGAAGSVPVNVDRNYFLFGRAVHLFEDSFSTEHTVRIPADNYTIVRQVKSYLCAPGSELHEHSESAILDYSSGDVVWLPGTGLDPSWKNYKASSMKTPALVATEASKDLWAAFIRTMGMPIDQRGDRARMEAQQLVLNWLNYNPDEMTSWYDVESHRDDTYVLAPGQTGKGRTVKQCMASLNVGTDDQMTYVRLLQANQRKCIYNAIPWPGYQDLADTSMNMYFDWQWLNKLRYVDPPPNYVIPQLPADTGTRVQIRSVVNNQPMISQDGIKPESWVYVKPGMPLDFILVGSKQDGVFRLTMNPSLFLSYRLTTGAVKLYQPTSVESPSNYKVAPAGRGWSIMSIPWGPSNGYMNYNSSTQSPYINSSGNPANPNSQWAIQGLQ